MSYTHPLSTDESWRKTRPGLFTFPEDIAQASLSTFAYDLHDQVGVKVMRLNQARREAPHVIQGCERMNFSNDFARYASERADDGFLVVIDSDVELKLPVSLFAELFPGGHSVLKNLIVASPGSNVTLIEHIGDSEGDQGLFTTNIIMGMGAKLDYRRYWQWNRPAFADVFFQLLEGSELKLTTYSEILSTAKIEQNILLKEPGSSVDEYIVDLVKDEAHIDFESHIEHFAPHTTSRLEARAVVDDRAYSLHHGSIRVGKEARGADSYFSSRNLLLSQDGKADSIPKLEIRTDEVKAGHGATVSDVDAGAIYYMMTRGLSRMQAEQLYVEGFIEEALRRFPQLGDMRTKKHVA